MLTVLLIADRNGLIPHFKIQLLHNQKEQKQNFELLIIDKQQK